MKKSNLYLGFGFIVLGVVLFIAGQFIGNGSAFAGLGGGFIGSGIVPVWKYFHWTKPENREEYEKRLETEQINLKDERKIMLRDKSGRAAYLVNMALITAITLIAVLVNAFGVYEVKPSILLGLTALIFFEYFLGLGLFKYYEKKL